MPLRREVCAVLQALQAKGIKTGLDIGFTNAGVSLTLRQSGGYWMSVEPTRQRQALVAAALGEETVLCWGEGGELPFEDKQFDAVVVAHGVLGGREQAEPVIKECHRVLKAGGHFVLTVPYRKRFGLAAAGAPGAMSGEGQAYDESDVFHLLKAGFDVVGFRYSCRFWVQAVRQWAERLGASRASGQSPLWLRALYRTAAALDAPLVLTKGYQMTVHGRRKGWRSTPAKTLGAGTPVSDAMLFDPRREGRNVSLSRFK